MVGRLLQGLRHLLVCIPIGQSGFSAAPQSLSKQASHLPILTQAVAIFHYLLTAQACNLCDMHQQSLQ
jgi:hypothetical protein